MAALAELHTHWKIPAETLIEEKQAGWDMQFRSVLQPLLPAFFGAMSSEIDAKRRAVLERVYDAIPTMRPKRRDQGAPLARIHGDAHAWNFLYPNDPDKDGCVLINWEDWHLNVGPADLNMLIAIHGGVEFRAEAEQLLLRQYWECLDWPDYDWNDVLCDYRIGHLWHSVVPVFHRLASEDGTEKILENWFSAYEALNCEALLRSL